MAALTGRARVALLAVVAVALAVAGFAVGRTTTPDRADAAAPSAVDVGFSQDMSVHHDQALTMATLAGTRGSIAVRQIANGILTSQSQEAGVLRGWLRLWGEPGADPHPMGWMASMRDSGAMGGMRMSSPTMPGMASGAELARLSRLHGRRFDVLFLQLMIRHHQGGILMADDARRHAALKVVRDAAAQMIYEQTDDIATMRALLRADGGKQLPPPR